MKILPISGLCTLCTLCLIGHLCAGTIHVYKDTQNPGDGTSWDEPLDSLQAAIGAASDGDEIHVAQGVYYPTDPPESGGGEGATFLLEGGSNIVGGFSPDGKARDPNLYKTVLSGDIFGDAGPTDRDGIPIEFVVSTSEPFNVRKSEHVITIANPKGPTTLDGLWIVDGHSHRMEGITENGGAGIWAQPGADLTLIQCHFRHHASESLGSGAAVLFDDFETELSHTLTITDCSFVKNGTPFGFNGDNHIGSRGSACYVHNGNIIITGSLFEENHSRRGGAIYLDGVPSESDKRPAYEIASCRFKGNRTKWGGGALYCRDYGSLTVLDSLFSGNHAGSPGFPNADGGAINMNSSHVGDIYLTGNTFGWNTAGGSVNEFVANGGAVNLDGLGSVWMRQNIFQENYAANVVTGAIPSSVDNLSGRTTFFYQNYDSVQEAASTIVDSDPSRPNYFIEDFTPTFTQPLSLRQLPGGDNVSHRSDPGGDLRPPWGSPVTDLGGPGVAPDRVDADGRKRKLGFGVDLGCFESPPPPGTIVIFEVSHNGFRFRIDYAADRPVAVWRSPDLKSWSPHPDFLEVDSSPFDISAFLNISPHQYYQLRYADGE